MLCVMTASTPIDAIAISVTTSAYSTIVWPASSQTRRVEVSALVLGDSIEDSDSFRFDWGALVLSAAVSPRSGPPPSQHVRDRVEDVVDLPGQDQESGDRPDRDHRQDQRVLDQRLTFEI